jgi:hypothetical protein
MPDTDPFISAARRIMIEALVDMRACIDGAPPTALNWRPGGDDTNTIAVLTVHALHSTRSWLAVALGAPLPQRDRPSEFVATAEDVQALQSFIDEMERETLVLIDAVGAAIDWAAQRQTHVRPRPDQSPIEPAAWALLHALEHLREHVGQMLLTRQLWDRK